MTSMKAYFHLPGKLVNMLSTTSGKLAFMEPGDRIAQARDKKGLSRRQLGDLVGVTQQAVGMWERGDISNIRLANLLKLLPALDMSLEHLMTGADSKKKRGASSETEHLSPEEETLVLAWRALPAGIKRHIHSLCTEYAATVLGVPEIANGSAENAERANAKLEELQKALQTETKRARRQKPPVVDRTDSDYHGPIRSLGTPFGRRAPKK